MSSSTPYLGVYRGADGFEARDTLSRCREGRVGDRLLVGNQNLFAPDERVGAGHN